MNLSVNGLRLIKGFEGFSSLPYRDVAGIWTWGYGHARKQQEEIPVSISQEDAEKLLQRDILPALSCVLAHVVVPINQNQLDALVSFTFNCGTEAFKCSTLLKKINESDMDSAENEFVRWNKAAGRVIEGLTRRREAEAELFRTPISTEEANV